MDTLKKQLFRLDFHLDYSHYPVESLCLWGEDAEKVVRHFHRDDPRRRVRVRMQPVDLSAVQTPECVIQAVEKRVYRDSEK